MKLKRINRDDLGFVEHNRMAVNIELLWLQNRNFWNFAQEFARTITHEFLHVELAKALGKNLLAVPAVEEEETIRAMVGEYWDMKLEREYEADE